MHISSHLAILFILVIKRSCVYPSCHCYCVHHSSGCIYLFTLLVMIMCLLFIMVVNSWYACCGVVVVNSWQVIKKLCYRIMCKKKGGDGQLGFHKDKTNSMIWDLVWLIFIFFAISSDSSIVHVPLKMNYSICFELKLIW